MGRRSFWYYLGNDTDTADRKLIYVMNMIKIHNDHCERIPDEETGEIIERGEDIDTVYYQTFKGKKDIWLCFYSGGGDWATYDFFEIKYPEFRKNLLCYDDFEKKKDYYGNKELWEYKELDLKKFNIRTIYDNIQNI